MREHDEKWNKGSEDTLRNRYITFLIGQEFYGMPIKHVMEIVNMQPITAIPHRPDYIKGVINLRGTVIPVMDAGLRMKQQPCDYNGRTCIIIIDMNGRKFGLVVDNVSEVLTISEEHVVENPGFSDDDQEKFIPCIGKLGSRMILLVDCSRL